MFILLQFKWIRQYGIREGRTRTISFTTRKFNSHYDIAQRIEWHENCGAITFRHQWKMSDYYHVDGAKRVNRKRDPHIPAVYLTLNVTCCSIVNLQFADKTKTEKCIQVHFAESWWNSKVKLLHAQGSILLLMQFTVTFMFVQPSIFKIHCDYNLCFSTPISYFYKYFNCTIGCMIGSIIRVRLLLLAFIGTIPMKISVLTVIIIPCNYSYSDICKHFSHTFFLNVKFQA